MKLATVADCLWGDKAKFRYLLFATILLLFAFLGGREIWTQEHRWADIVSGMFFRHDFLHPYLGNNYYYDKPLLSYWLIVFFVKIFHGLNTWTLRLPSACAGLLAIWSIYRLGTKLKNQQLGLLSGWLLVTTFYFVFWARCSSADMLNLAGSLFAIAWYYEHREQAGFFDYAIFFLILAVTSLCKGLIGLVVPLIAVWVDIVLQQSWRQHLRWSFVLSPIPAIVVYLAPFVASTYFMTNSYGQNGLYLVYQENILRYFKPFDHQGPIYTYLIYLPIYLLPSTIWLFPAIFALKSRWKTMSIDQKWIVWTLTALFLFFSLSGSRRSYYVLPMVPFAVLLMADWLLSATRELSRRWIWSAGIIVSAFLILLAGYDVGQEWYYSQFGADKFATSLKAEANKIRPWQEWNVVVLDAESKFNFYLQLPPTVISYHIKGNVRHLLPSENQLLALWPALLEHKKNTIFITRKLYQPLLQHILKDYRVFEINYPEIPFVARNNTDIAIAYIPA